MQATSYILQQKINHITITSVSLFSNRDFLTLLLIFIEIKESYLIFGKTDIILLHEYDIFSK